MALTSSGCCVNDSPSHACQCVHHPAEPGDHLVVAEAVILSPGIETAMALWTPYGLQENRGVRVLWQ